MIGLAIAYFLGFATPCGIGFAIFLHEAGKPYAR